VKSRARCDAEQLFGTESVVLSAGGSAYFDQVVKALGAVRLSRPRMLFCVRAVTSLTIMAPTPPRWIGSGNAAPGAYSRTTASSPHSNCGLRAILAGAGPRHRGPR